MFRQAVLRNRVYYTEAIRLFGFQECEWTTHLPGGAGYTPMPLGAVTACSFKIASDTADTSTSCTS